MWTLYDPMIRPEQSEHTIGERKREDTDTHSNRPNSLEKVWFLLEPFTCIPRRISESGKQD